MRIFGITLRDRDGWPVVTFEGFNPITNPIRLLLHTNIAKTWELRKRTIDCPWDNTTVEDCEECVQARTYAGENGIDFAAVRQKVESRPIDNSDLRAGLKAATKMVANVAQGHMSIQHAMTFADLEGVYCITRPKYWERRVIIAMSGNDQTLHLIHTRMASSGSAYCPTIEDLNATDWSVYYPEKACASVE
jgi:hypothetical protein